MMQLCTLATENEALIRLKVQTKAFRRNITTCRTQATNNQIARVLNERSPRHNGRPQAPVWPSTPPHYFRGQLPTPLIGLGNQYLIMRCQLQA